MPREFRKRGRGGKQAKTSKAQDDDGLSPTSLNPLLESNLNKDVIELALEGGVQEKEIVVGNKNPDPSKAYPELSPDLRAYWRAIDDQIQELDRLGFDPHSAKHESNYDDADEEEDERHLILRSALSELVGHELSLATDPEASIILERLIYNMDEFAKRVLADKLIVNFIDLCSHPQGSHVIQTLLALSAPVLDRESQVRVPDRKEKSKGDSEDLPLMSLLLTQACEDLLPHLDRLSQDRSGSHVLVILFLLVFGKPIAEENCRSRNSTKWRSKQGPMRSVFHQEDSGSKSDGAVTNRQVPPTLTTMGNKLYQQMKSNWTMLDGTGVRNAASNPSTVILLRLIIDLEFDKGEAESPRSLTDLLLGGLIQNQPSSSRSEFVEVCLRDVTASRVIEGIIGRLSAGPFSRFYSSYLAGRMGQLSSHPVANFIVARAISRLELEQFLPALEEYKPKMIDCIDNYRTGSFKSFVERSVCFSPLEQQAVAECILRAFGIEDEADYRFVFPCLISLMRLEYFRKTTAFNLISSSSSTEPGPIKVKLPESNMQGSLLLQAILQQNIPTLSTKIVKGLTSLPLEVMIAFSRDPIGSRPLDVLLSSTTILPSSRRHFILAFLGNFHTLVDDRIGSRIAELCFSVADVYLKEKIAMSLASQQHVLQRSAFACFFLKKIELPLFERQIDSWKSKMGSKFPAKRYINQQQQQVKIVPAETKAKGEDVTGEKLSKVIKKSRSNLQIGKDEEVIVELREKEKEGAVVCKKKEKKGKKRKVDSDEIITITNTKGGGEVAVIDDLFNLVSSKKKVKK